MKKRVLLIHGWKGKPTSNWFPWLEWALLLRAVDAKALTMPRPDKPKLNVWVNTIAEEVGMPNKNTFFVGHSLGGIAILRYLEMLPRRTRIGGVIMVAGFSESIGRSEITTFFKHALDYEHIRHITAIQSTNDPYVPFARGKTLRDKLGAKLITIKDGGHLNTASGFTTLPVVLDALIEFKC